MLLFFLERGECVPHRTDDAFLLRFIRARNFKIEGAHRLVRFSRINIEKLSSKVFFFVLQLVNYYDFKENNPQFYENVDLLALMKIGEDGIITVPPYREQTGRRVLLYRWGLFFLYLNLQLFSVKQH